MAEIKIEKKKPIWPWILLVLIILGVIAYFIYTNEDRTDDYTDDYTNEEVYDDRTVPMEDTYSTPDTSRTYNEFTAFAGAINDSTRVAVDSSYTKKAYWNLSKAVVRTAELNNIEDSPELEDLRNFSVLLTGVSTPRTDMKSFKNFKTASDKVAKVLKDVQQKSFPELKDEVEELKKHADAISPSVKMGDQPQKINAFLVKSRDVINSMNP